MLAVALLLAPMTLRFERLDLGVTLAANAPDLRAWRDLGFRHVRVPVADADEVARATETDDLPVLLVPAEDALSAAFAAARRDPDRVFVETAAPKPDPGITRVVPVSVLPERGEPNDVYTLRFVRPAFFTEGKSRTPIPFPAPRSVPRDAEDPDAFRAYVREGWNADRVAREIAAIGEEARRRRLRMRLDDLGASRTARIGDRAEWLRAVSTAAAEQGLARCLADANGPRGFPRADSVLVSAFVR